jgi:GTP cyclohydrolase IA
MYKNNQSADAIMDSYEELLSAQYTDKARILKKVGVAGQFGGLVCEARIKFSSKRLPKFPSFSGFVDIVYEPGKYVIGFGKAARLVREQAVKLQYQEKLSQEIAETFMTEGGAKGVLVRTRAQHLCFGLEYPVTATSVALGTLTNPEKQSEAQSLIQHAYA